FIGANSSVELAEKLDRTEDAKNAIKAALEEGYVVGGGKALLNAMLKIGENNKLNETEAEKLGYMVVMRSLDAPFKQILKNLYREETTKSIFPFMREKLTDVAYREALTFDVHEGWDVKNIKRVNLIEAGIIDPVKVTKAALHSAFSVVSTVIDSNVVLALTGTNGDINLAND